MSFTYWEVEIISIDGKREKVEKLDREAARRVADGAIADPGVIAINAKEVEVR